MIERRLRVLCVCSHNRTRSVMMAALVRHHLQIATLAAGGTAPLVADVGIGPAGLPITPGVAEAIARLHVPLGADPERYTSRSMTDRMVDEADVILTAQVSNVISASTRARDVFPKAFTLPEFVARAAAVGPRRGDDLAAWLQRIGEGRRSSDYLRADVAEIADPTGSGDGAIQRCASDIDLLARRLAELWV